MKEKQANLPKANKDNEVQPFVPPVRHLVRRRPGEGGRPGDVGFVAFCKTHSVLRSLCLFAAILLLAFVNTAQAQFTWTTNADNTITITSYTGPDGDVSIPSAITSLPVTRIGHQAFDGRTGLANITIPDGVISIGGDAFFACSLASVTIPGSVTNIGANAFVVCSRLMAMTVEAGNAFYSSVNGVLFDKNQAALLQYPGGLGGSYTIPGSVTNIAAGAFVDCAGLTNVTVPNSVTSISDGAFAGCSALTNVAIPSSVTSIGDDAFQSTGLTSVTIPGSITNIGMGAFYACAGLTAVRILPGSLASIGPQAFGYCSSLSTLIIGEGIPSIGESAFVFCTRLHKVTIPAGVTNIADSAFEDCGLTSVTIPDSVTSIAEGAFADCDGLTTVFFKGNAPTADWTVFDFDNNATVYYLPGATGWYDFNDNTGIPIVLWNPLVQTGDGSFGVQNGQFGFNITGTPDIPIMVQASTTLANPVWTPLATMTLTNGSVYFSEPLQTNTPARFYRIGSP
jgi:hypothetical protein